MRQGIKIIKPLKPVFKSVFTQQVRHKLFVLLGLAFVGGLVWFYNSCGEVEFTPDFSKEQGKIKFECTPQTEAGIAEASTATGGVASEASRCYIKDQGLQFTSSLKNTLKITPPSSLYKQMQLNSIECQKKTSPAEDEEGEAEPLQESEEEREEKLAIQESTAEEAWQSIVYTLPEYEAPFDKDKLVVSVRFRYIDEQGETQVSGCAYDQVVYDALAPEIDWVIEDSISADVQNLSTHVAQGDAVQLSFSTFDSQSGVGPVRCSLDKIQASESESVLAKKACAEHIDSTEDDSYELKSLDTGQQHLVNYKNLPTGLYTFKVEVEDRLGHSSELQHSFRVGEVNDEGPQMQPKTKSISVEDHTDEVDILFVVDNSGSMGDEQRSLANNLSGFINVLSDLNYRVAVSTTDSYVSGDALITMANNRFFVQASDSRAEAVLKRVVHGIGTAGSATECGIRSVYNRLEKLRRGTSFQGSNFFRASAHLVVIVLSDEGDACLSQANPSQLLASFSVLKKHQRQNNLKLVWNSMLNHSHHAGYAELSQKTQGVLGNVRQPYAPQLQAMGDQIKNLVRSVDLGCAPLPVYAGGQQIEVYLNEGGTRSPVTIDRASCTAACTNNSECIANCQWLDYRVQNKSIVFEGPLPRGDYEVEYYCTGESGRQ